jgi:DNA ligase-1
MIKLDQVKILYKKHGDLGLVAEAVLEEVGMSLENESLTISQVHQALVKIAQDEGTGSQDRKVEALKDLLLKLDPLSARYVSRVVIGKLRLGFSTKTIMDALSWVTTKSKDESKLIEEAYQKKADLGELAENYLKVKDQPKRQELLKNYAVEAGIPVVPALCQRLNSAQEIIDKLGEVYAEPKYDGLRVQIHFQKKNHPKTTNHKLKPLPVIWKMFPICFQSWTNLPQILNCDSCILDAEAIGYDPKTQEVGRVSANHYQTA